MADYTVILDSLRTQFLLGIHPHEAEPQRVDVSVEMRVSYPSAPADDAIAEVLDYDFIRDGILALAGTRRFALQETLCEAIAAMCLAHDPVRQVTVRTIKAGVYPDARIGCEIVRVRA